MVCLGTDVEGINNIIIDGENGYLCKTDKQSIREALKKIILNSKSNNLIKERARKTIESDYSLKKIVGFELSLYQKYNFKTGYAQG
jgi:glycosyltransferase involved in cell wall biosynthesis